MAPAAKKPAAEKAPKAEAKPAAKKSAKPEAQAAKPEAKPAATKGTKSAAAGQAHAESNGKPAAKKKQPIKDPEGGLTQAGRDRAKETAGANLNPGVQGPADELEEMKRRGSFLRRHFTTLAGPLVGDDGKPTRLALQAKALGERVPKTEEDAAKLAAKGERLLTKYKKLRDAEKAEKKATAKAEKDKAKADKAQAAESK